MYPIAPMMMERVEWRAKSVSSRRLGEIYRASAPPTTPLPPLPDMGMLYIVLQYIMRFRWSNGLGNCFDG